MKTHFDGPRVAPWMGRLRCVMIPALILILLLPSSATPARAAEPTVVGDGTPESCTLDALNQAIADVPAGGTITFNCGPDAVTIWIADVYIQKDLTIDGGGSITFTGGGRDEEVLHVFAGAMVRFMNFTVADAEAVNGGPIYNEGTLTLHRVTVTGGRSGHGTGPGGISNGGVLMVEDSTIAGNSAGCHETGCGRAGGIGNWGTMRVINSTISGNGSGDLGGGIYNAGTMHVVNSIISGNLAALSGAGIYNAGTATIENSTNTGNVSYCQGDGAGGILFCSPGGGIYNTGTMSLINSTISGNSAGATAGGSGGGIANDGTLLLQNTTITDNTAESGGGLANTNAVMLQNSLLAGNTNANQEPSDCSGTLISQGYNLIGSTTGCAIDGDTTGNLLNVNPLLGPLQDNGGPTLTHNLLPGSPAIDAGSPAVPGSGGTACEATDQRGVARPQDGDGDGLARCDIGAVEFEFMSVSIDIKPGSNTNPINLSSNGVIPVAILSTSTFAARNVLPASVEFGPNGASSISSNLKDVNGDGRLDLLLHFRTQQTGIQPGDTQACLMGQTRSGVPIYGCDTIHIP